MTDGMLMRAINKLKAKNKRTKEPGGKSTTKAPKKAKPTKTKTQKEIDDEIRRRRAERAAKKKGSLKL